MTTPPAFFPMHVIRSSILWLLLFLVVSLADAAHAVEVKGLYETAVPVEGQEAEQRNAAIAEALGQVLIKVTGHRDIVARGQLEEKLKSGADYVRQYRYQQTVWGDRLLKVGFDEHAVNRLLNEQGLPVWGVNRPLVLFWLGIEEQGERRIAVPELDSALFAQVEAAMERRGLPAAFPLMDLTDRAALPAGDLWGDFAANIRKASKRFDANLILVGRLAASGEKQWQSRWTLYSATGSSSWKGQGANQAETVNVGVQVLADRLAQRYAPIREKGERSRIRIHVGGIQRLDDYERVNDYLLKLDAVEQADLHHAEPDAVVYELVVNGDQEVLQREIALGSLLQPQSQPQLQSGQGPEDDASGSGPDTAPVGGEIVLYYQLQP